MTGQLTFAHVHGVIHGRLTGRLTVAHALFDRGAVAAARCVHDRPAIETRWLDSVRVARRAWPDLDNRRLSGLARFLGLPHRHHDALSDARAAGWVIVRATEHTGLSVADWMALPHQPGPAPKPAPNVPLAGERVAILGEPHDGALAHAVPGFGGKLRSSVGLTTTMLVIAADKPFGRSIRASTVYRRASKAAADGRGLRIVAVSALTATSPTRSCSTARSSSTVGRPSGVPRTSIRRSCSATETAATSAGRILTVSKPSLSGHLDPVGAGGALSWRASERIGPAS